MAKSIVVKAFEKAAKRKGFKPGSEPFKRYVAACKKEKEGKKNAA